MPFKFNKLLRAILAGGGGVSLPLRSVSAQSSIATSQFINTRGSGVNTTLINRIPVVFGSASVDSINLIVNGWYLQSSVGVTALGNGYQIDSCAFEFNGTYTPVYFGGLRAKYINELDTEIYSDAITAASLGAPSFAAGSVGYIRIAITTPTGARLPTSPTSTASGTGMLHFDPLKTSLPNGIDGTGLFTYTMINGGINATDVNFSNVTFPVVVVGRHSSPVVAFIGDSKMAGSGDTTTATTFARGPLRSLFSSVASTASAKAGIQFGCNGSIALDHGAGANAALLQNYYKYASHAVVGYGTNSINTSAQSALHTLIRAKGISKIIQLSLTPRTTGTFTTPGGQTKVGGWSAAGSADTFEAFLRGLIAGDDNMTYYSLSAIRDSFDGGDYWLWRSTGGVSRTDDGLHENALGNEEGVGTAGQAITLAGGTVPTTLRALVQAL